MHGPFGEHRVGGGRGSWLLENRHDVPRKPLQLLQDDLLVGSDDLSHVDFFQARVALLQLVQALDQTLRRSDHPGAACNGLLQRRQRRAPRQRRIAERSDLLFGQSRHKSERSEHLHPLFEEWPRLTNRLLFGLGDVEHDANHQVAARLSLASLARERLLPRGDRLRGRSTSGRASTDDTFDAMPGHEVEAARTGADNRLKALYRAAEWARNQCDLLQLVPAVWHSRRNGVVLAAMRE